MSHHDHMTDWLAKRAAISGDVIALYYSEKQWTFAELHNTTNRVVSWLQKNGVQPGDHVAMFQHNTPLFIKTVHALARLGAVCVPLNVRLTDHELIQQVHLADVHCIVHDELYAARAAVVAKQAGVKALNASGANLSSVPEWPAAEHRVFAMDDVHTIVFTSGTTGTPKGAMLTYRNHWWSAVGSVLNLGLQADDVWLACMPLFHVGGLSIIMRSVIYGMPIVLHDRFQAEAVHAALEQNNITLTSFVSTMLARVLEARSYTPFPPSLRCVLTGGGPVPGQLLEQCRRLRVPLVQTYGLTETASQVVTLAPQDALVKLGSAGRPLFPVDIRIMNDAGQAAPGEMGEIHVRGPQVMAGYYKNEAETNRVLCDGWLRTGDVGYKDEDGYVFVVDRRADLLISGGENVYPAEIESIVEQQPAVKEAVVVAKTDDEWGQVPVAFVQLQPGEEENEQALLDHCRQRLAAYKVPKHIYFVSDFPRNASGKILRRVLREQVDGKQQ